MIFSVVNIVRVNLSDNIDYTIFHLVKIYFLSKIATLFWDVNKNFSIKFN